MQIAILGLDAQGRAIAEKLMTEGHQVVVWNAAKEVLEQYRVEKAEFVVNGTLQISHSIESLQQDLRKPRIFMTVLAAGAETETGLQDLLNIAEAGDVVIDGGTSYFKDTKRRSPLFEQKGIRFIDIGIAGGVLGFSNGFSLMAGGNQEGYEYIAPILDTLAKPNGEHGYFGASGAGHYLKMVHDSVEAVVLQALAEGFGLLTKSDYHFNLSSVASLWQGGSMVAGYLLDLVTEVLTKDTTVLQSEGSIPVNEAGKWAVQEGHDMRVPIELVERVMDFSSRSQYDRLVQETVAARLVAAVEKLCTGKQEKQTENQQ